MCSRVALAAGIVVVTTDVTCPEIHSVNPQIDTERERGRERETDGRERRID